MLSFPQVSLLVREAGQAFSRDNAPRLAAALTYFSIFALVPVLILAFTAIGAFLGNPDFQNTIVNYVTTNFSKEIGQQLGEMFKASSDKVDLKNGLTSGLLVGLVGLAWAASNLFVQLQGALNELWNVPPSATGGFMGMMRTRAEGLLMVLGFGVVLLVFFGLNAYLSALGGGVLARLGTLVIGAVLLTGIFAVIYRVLPNVKLQWKDVLVGSAITAVLFSILQLVISWYFGNFAPASAFGAASSLILLLLWIYYNSMLLLFGAELTYVYAKHFGSSEASLSARIKEDAYLSKAEARAIAYAAETGSTLTPQQRQRAWSRATGQPQPQSMLTIQQATPKPVLPSVPGALWNALSAVLAVPALILVKLLKLGGTKYVPEKRATVRSDEVRRR